MQNSPNSPKQNEVNTVQAIRIKVHRWITINKYEV